MAGIPKPVSNKQQKGEWSTGLFGCFEDYTVCLLTCFCPCITAGRVVEIVDRGQTSCGASGVLYALLGCYIWKRSLCLYSCSYRSKLRSQYLLKESPLPDCCVHLFCHECALCQEYRELQNRGFNMAAGWHGNVETQPPAVQGGMNR